MAKIDDIYSLMQIDTTDEKCQRNITEDKFFGFPIKGILEAEKKLQDPKSRSVAYYSMEFGLAPSIYHSFRSATPVSEDNIVKQHEVFSNLRAMDYFHSLPIEKILDLPIYSGGLGVLAGDALKSAADLKMSLVGVGIMWNKGYFKQKFWFKYGQVPEQIDWDPITYPGLVPLNRKITMPIEGEEVVFKLWKYYVFSFDKKNVIPLVLLDSNCPENKEYFRKLTDQLYQSDNIWWKTVQRKILGVGGDKSSRRIEIFDSSKPFE